MEIRKEPVLFVVTALLGAWIAKGLLADVPLSSRFQPTKIEYAATPVTQTVLATGDAPALARRDFATEPSETRPLPPRALEFPPHAPLSVAALPLPIGPDYGHLYAVRVPGEPVEGVTLQTVADAEAAEGEDGGDVAAAAAPAAGGQGNDEEQLARTYDRIWVVGQKAPQFGAIEPDGRDVFELEALRDFEGVVVRMRVYRRSDGKMGSLVTFGKDRGTQIERIELANTLRNEVERRVRAVPADAAHHAERRALIAWLLDKGREADWVHDVALQQADLYRQVSHGDLEGLRLQQRVLRARGDLAAEFRLLDELQGDHRETAFRYEGLGVVKAKLGLVEEAERDLRHAVTLAPTDPRVHAALAEFLRQQGRSEAAVTAAQQAQRTFGSLQNDDDRVRVVRAIVACQLAVDAVDAARAGLELLSVERRPPYLAGCIAYAAGDVAAALGAFRQASTGTDGSDALLGQAACLLREDQWQDAHDLFVRVGEQQPLLRHRAATGLALLFCRLGQFDAANAWIDRALEAAPADPYAFYLRGHALRRQGQLAAAVEAQTAALQKRDDFVHAIAEMAAVQALRAAEGRGTDGAEAAIAARRYADRAVALVHEPATELFELQGLYRFGAADARGARSAFLAARDEAAGDGAQLFARGSLAIVDYSRGLVDEAVEVLQRLVEDLPREDATRAWAEATLTAIDDHAQKELLEDAFARAEVGSVWTGESDGARGARIEDEALTFEVPSLSSSTTLTAERTGAVQNGKNFLAVACTMQLGPKQPGTDAFAGLRIEMQRGGGGSGAPELRAEVGVRDGKPYVRIEDGRDGGRSEPVKLEPTVNGFERSGAQRLELRVVPRGDVQGRNLTLQVWWNDQIVHQHDLKTLTGNTTIPLKTVLFAEGRKGAPVDVEFDDYRLERRKGS